MWRCAFAVLFGSAFFACAPRGGPSAAPQSDETAAPAALEPGRVYDLEEFGQMPELTNPSELHSLMARNYPPALLNAGVGGMTIVAMIIGTDGRVEEATVQRSSGHIDMDRAAHEVAMHARFSPLTIQGHPVRIRATFPINFEVERNLPPLPPPPTRPR